MRIFLMSSLLAIGCGSEVAENQAAIHAAELPPVAGCDSLSHPAALHRPAATRLELRAVAGVDDLYLASAGGVALCIDSIDGIQAMALRLSFLPPRELASSNPMPGDPGNGNAGSNPMPGDPGNNSGNAGSNPMPGDDHKH
jgi:hypothetical protein